MDKPNNMTAHGFFQFDIRVGTIRSVEPVPKSKKLLKVEVGFGSFGNRTILAGLAPHIPLDAPGPGCHIVEGQKVVAIVNLEPRVMMGIESFGMLLAASDGNGKIVLVNPGDVPDGAEVG